MQGLVPALLSPATLNVALWPFLLPEMSLPPQAPADKAQTSSLGDISQTVPAPTQVSPRLPEPLCFFHHDTSHPGLELPR